MVKKDDGDISKIVLIASQKKPSDIDQDEGSTARPISDEQVWVPEKSLDQAANETKFGKNAFDIRFLMLNALRFRFERKSEGYSLEITITVAAIALLLYLLCR